MGNGMRYMSLKLNPFNKQVAPYLFISPFFLSFAVFMIWPIIYAFSLSLHEFQGLAQSSYVGSQNYRALFHDVRFIKAFYNTTYFACSMLVLFVPLAMAMALILNLRGIPGRNLFRLSLFLPVLTTTVAAGVVFRLIYVETPGGVLNSILKIFGVSPKRWLLDSNLVLKSVIGLAVWRTLGLNTMYMIAGLQSLPADLYEAALIDGAGPWQQLRYLTIPLMKPVISFVSIITLIHSYQVFTEVFVLQPSGSPHDSAVTLAYHLYETAFRFFKLGYGSAVGFVMTFIILLLSLLQLKVLGVFRTE